MYDYILFDLDGTLTDSARGIINSIVSALEERHIKVENRDFLYSFVGPPLIDSFQKTYGFTREESMACVMTFRKYFESTGMYENELYPRIPEMLENLKDSGKKLILATAKPEIFATKILEHFEIRKYFDYVAGASQDESRTKKTEVINYALHKAGIDGNDILKKTVMVGDRNDDVLGAKKFGLDSIGVLYGYGSRKELESAGATYFAETPEEIISIIRR